MSPLKEVRILGALTFALVFVVGCSETTPAPPPNDHIHPQYDLRGRLERLSYDRDGDGKIDTWGYMDGARVVRIEIDENGDGKVDRWEFYSGAETAGDAGRARASDPPGLATLEAAGAVSSGAANTLERIERSTRHDGKVSRKEFFEHGRLARVEEDTDGDGRIDKWETYSGGVLATMELDTDGRGRPTRRLVYGANGAIERVDADRNGHFETVTR